MLTRIFRFTASRQMPQPLWKVTLRSGAPLNYFLLNQWQEKIEVYASLRRAKAAVLRHEANGGQLLMSAEIEQYWPGENVVPFMRLNPLNH